ncbi:MAG: hypothetical protein HYY00_07100 [Chloroflexi bacterium]|nr:hypothetical protein [Chloroflexota bacterium]
MPYPHSGKPVRRFFRAEAKALLDAYRNVETLLPAKDRKGSTHSGEEGRYVESLLRSFLDKHLPRELKAFSGFVLRPATKVGSGNKGRLPSGDEHSPQLDVIVYDVAHFPMYVQFEEFVVVPPEGVVAVISVKKTLYRQELPKELEALSNVVRLCRYKNVKEEWVRGPNISLFGFSREDGSVETWADDIFNGIKDCGEHQSFDSLVGQTVVIDAFTVFKARPEPDAESIQSARYVLVKHKEDEEHLGLQFLLTGILSVYHDATRTDIIRAGFTSFESGRSHDRELGIVSVKGLRCRE